MTGEPGPNELRTHPAQAEFAPMGQHERPSHTIAHLSDLHLLGGGHALFGRVDSENNLKTALHQLEHSGIRPDAIVISGDVADRGEADAYRRAKAAVVPAAGRMGAQVIWVMGNHDVRGPFRTELLGERPHGKPVDRVVDVNGLRIVSLDTSVPGFHHGEIDDSQLHWLADVLSQPARHGTVLALHHPPIPSPVAVMDILELRDQHRLAAVIRDTDVRVVLAGHVHYTTTGTCGGVPVLGAGATSYTMDLSAPVAELHGIDGGQSFSLVHIHREQVVHSAVPLGTFEQVSGIGAEFLVHMQQLDRKGRQEAFSRMPAGVTDQLPAGTNRELN